MKGISLQGLSFSYGDRVILKNIDFNLVPGRLQLIEGYSGAGKTTLLNLMAGFLKPQAGVIIWDGKVIYSDIKNREIDKKRPEVMGIIYSDFRLVEHLSGWENIILPSVVSGCTFAKGIVEEMLEVFFRKEFSEEKGRVILSRPVSQLSHGQRERISVLRAFSVAPPYVIADEMFSAINPELKKRLWSFVKKICREHDIGLLAVTHDQYLIEKDTDFIKYELKKKKINKKGV